MDRLPARRALFALALGMPWLAGCSTTGMLAALTRFPGRVDRDVAYGPHARHLLDIYRPLPEASVRATVLFLYGGSWNRGERGEYAFVGRSLASRGITTVIADYRLYPEVRYPDFMIDCAMAGAWTLREAERLGGDPDRVFVMGHSAGAYNAAMLALDARWLVQQGQDPRRWAGFIGMAGPYEFLPITNPDAQPVFHHPDYPVGTQPIEHASPVAPRTLLITARSDDLVNPVRNSAAMARKLLALGVAVRHESFPRVDHRTLIAAMSSPLSWLAPVNETIAGFIGQQ